MKFSKERRRKMRILCILLAWVMRETKLKHIARQKDETDRKSIQIPNNNILKKKEYAMYKFREKRELQKNNFEVRTSTSCFNSHSVFHK